MRLATSNLLSLWERNLTAVAREERDDVGVGVEAGAFLRDVVGDDHVRAFARELAAGVFGEAFGFGGKTDEHTATARLRGIATKLGENIGVFKLRREIRVLRLPLFGIDARGVKRCLTYSRTSHPRSVSMRLILRLRGSGTIVGDCGGHDDDGRIGGALAHGVRISSVERTGTQSTPSGTGELRGAADENDVRAATRRRLPPARSPFCRRSDW